MKIIREACVETLTQCLNAEKNGADRLELCGDLAVGGITPAQDILESVLAQVRIPVKVMVRPRGGNFVHSPVEIEQIKQDIKMCHRLGVREIVCGFLTQSGEIDRELTAEIAALAAPLRITFHKAIDETPDIFAAVKTLKTITGVTSILSSGGVKTAAAGAETLRRMQEHCGDKIQLIAAGKVTQQNLTGLHARIGTQEYHGRLIVGAL